MNKFIAWLRTETAASIIMAFAALSAIIIANSPLSGYYLAILDMDLSIKLAQYKLKLSLLLWINDFVMAWFFLYVAMEIKHELIGGELSTNSQRIAPLLAAISGMAVPSLIYYILNYHNPDSLAGWAIPSATDIAFAMAVINLFGRKLPKSLKIFLLAVAIFDDLGAILIIAFFYSHHLSIHFLAYAALITTGLLALNHYRIQHPAPYLILGCILWYFVLQSGIHASIAGVIIGLTIPAYTDNSNKRSPLERLTTKLAPWVNYGILPVFAFANSAIVFGEISLDQLISPMFLGVALGLLLGKQIGVFGMIYILLKFGWYQLPNRVKLAEFWGTCILTGIGFTMSLFISQLAFSDPLIINELRLSIFVGSILSGAIGYVVLNKTT